MFVIVMMMMVLITMAVTMTMGILLLLLLFNNTSEEINSGKEVVRTAATLEAGDQLHQDPTSSVSDVCLRISMITITITSSVTITTATSFTILWLNHHQQQLHSHQEL